MLRTIILFTLLALAPARAHSIDGERCLAMVRNDQGESRALELPGYSVLTAPPPLRLPTGLTNVVALMCVRSSLFMSDKDYRVLTDLRLPFSISDGERMVWFHIADMRLLMHMDEGKLSAEEADRFARAVDRAQTVMMQTGW